MANLDPDGLPAVFAHPALISVTALAKIVRDGGDPDGPEMFDALCERSTLAGVKPCSAVFDRAAEMVGIPYSMELDLYCSREMRDEARRQYGHLYRNARERC